MDNIPLYVFTPILVISGIFLLYDNYIVAPRESADTLSALKDFQEARILRFIGGLSAFNFEAQRIVIVRRKTQVTLDISKIRDCTGHWTQVSKDSNITEENFYILLTITDINDPEIKIYFRQRKNLAVFRKVITQLAERRRLVVTGEGGGNLLEENRVDGQVIVLTAIEAETRSVLYSFEQTTESTVAGRVFYHGTFEGLRSRWSVHVAEVGPRNVNAALIAERAIKHFKPNIALFVGIAGGIKDVKLGDVVAATKIYSYESGKETKAGFKPRPELRLISHVLEQRARSIRFKGNWVKRLRKVHPEMPTAFVEPIAAGDVVIGSSKSHTAQLIKSFYGDAVAAEMEGYGFLSALHLNPLTHGIVIRGISDLFDEKSRTDAEGWQTLAADSAAAFSFEMLAEIDPHKDMTS